VLSPRPLLAPVMTTTLLLMFGFVMNHSPQLVVTEPSPVGALSVP